MRVGIENFADFAYNPASRYSSALSPALARLMSLQQPNPADGQPTLDATGIWAQKLGLADPANFAARANSGMLTPQDIATIGQYSSVAPQIVNGRVTNAIDFWSNAVAKAQANESGGGGGVLGIKELSTGIPIVDSVLGNFATGNVGGQTGYNAATGGDVKQGAALDIAGLGAGAALSAALPAASSSITDFATPAAAAPATSSNAPILLAGPESAAAGTIPAPSVANSVLSDFAAPASVDAINAATPGTITMGVPEQDLVGSALVPAGGAAAGAAGAVAAGNSSAGTAGAAGATAAGAAAANGVTNQPSAPAPDITDFANQTPGMGVVPSPNATDITGSTVSGVPVDTGSAGITNQPLAPAPDPAATGADITMGQDSGIFDLGKALGSIGLGGLVNAGASLEGANLQAQAARDAAQIQANATKAAIDEQGRQFDLTRSDLAPYRAAGTTALTNLTGGVGSDGTNGPLTRKFTIDDFWSDPVVKASYDAGLKLGTTALKNRAPLTTGLDSGAALKELTQFGTDYTGNMAAGSYGRFTNDQTNTFNKNAAVAGIGQTGVNTGVNAGQNTAANVSNLISSGGNAQAASNIAGANAWGGALNNIANWWQGQQVLGQLQNMRTPGVMPIQNWGGSTGYGY